MAKVGCIHLSFSYLLHPSPQRQDSRSAVCTFHFTPLTPLILPFRRAITLYAPFIFTPLTPQECKRYTLALLYAPFIFAHLIPHTPTE